MDLEQWNALIEDVQLLGGGVLLQQLAGDLALGGQHDTVLCEDTESCAGMRNGFEGIFDLVQAALGREDGRLFEDSELRAGQRGKLGTADS